MKKQWMGLLALMVTATAYGNDIQEFRDIGVNMMFTPGGGVFAVQSEIYKNRYDNFSFIASAGNFGYRHTVNLQDNEKGSGYLAGFGARYYTDTVTEGIYFGADLALAAGNFEKQISGTVSNHDGVGLLPTFTMGYSFGNRHFKVEPNAILAPLGWLDGDSKTTWLVGLGLSIRKDFR